MPATLEAPPAAAPAPAQPSPVQPSPFGTPLSKPMEDAFSKLKQASKGDDGAKIARARGDDPPPPQEEKAIAPVKEIPPKEEPKPEPKRADLDDQYDDEEEAEPKEEKVEEEKPEEEAAKDTKEQPKGEEVKADNKRQSPWKLVAKLKDTLLQRESELAELRTKPPQQDPAIGEKLSTYEKRIKEYEEELRFSNYQKHPEFLEKYQKPYEDAFDKAGKELRGLKISFVDPNSGETQARDLTLQDISVLASMDPAEARALIKDKFPQDAEEVKYHIKEIRRLAEARAQVLETAKKGATEREQRMAEAHKQAQEQSMKLWEQYNREAQEKYDWLKPKEGEQERNERLAKAQGFVDKALTANPNDPRLTPEQRSEVIKSHSALRNRAIGFTVLRHENKTLRARNAELEEALKAYQKSEPTNGQSKSSKTEQVEGAVTLDGVAARMAGYARGGASQY